MAEAVRTILPTYPDLAGKVAVVTGGPQAICDAVCRTPVAHAVKPAGGAPVQVRQRRIGAPAQRAGGGWPPGACHGGATPCVGLERTGRSGCPGSVARGRKA